MDVLLDTNAILSAGLDKPAFKSLRDYLDRTQCRLLLSAVVLEELLARRRSEVHKLSRGLASAFKDLRRLDPENDSALPQLDPDAIVESQRAKIMAAAARVEIVHNVPEDLPALVLRLANRTRPASEGGEEARDVLVWFAVLRSVADAPLAFITNDDGFYQSKVLHPDLVRELGASASNLATFHNLDEFLATHHSRISYVTKEWIEKVVEDNIVNSAMQEAIDGHDDLFRERISELGEPSGYVSVIQFIQHEVTDFIVSDLPSDELYVGATIWAELEVEVEYYTRGRDEDHWPYRSNAQTKCIYPCVLLQLQMEVHEGSVVSAEINEIELA